MPVDPVSLALQATSQGLSSLIGGIVGIGQKRQGKRLLKRIGDDPVETMPAEVSQNQQQARINANTGLPSEQYNQAMKNIQRQQLMALRGANDRRGGLLAISGIQQAGNDAMGNLDVANAKQRLQNQNTLYGVNNQVAGWKSRLFDQNIRQKYNRDRSYALGLIGAGNQNLVGGADKLGAGAINAANAYGNRNKQEYDY